MIPGLKRHPAGQVVLEYILMIAFTIFIVSMVGLAFRRTIWCLWQSYVTDIAAPCPGCPMPQNTAAQFYTCH